LSRVTELFNGVFFQSPEAVAGDAADSRQYFQFFNEWVLDPNTGIIAGFLNARDDLATAVLTANNDFPTELGSTATTEWANMPELVQSTGSTLLAELGTLLNPADLFAA
jgi:hypothetical protein